MEQRQVAGAPDCQEPRAALSADASALNITCIDAELQLDKHGMVAGSIQPNLSASQSQARYAT
jgi:hypothetical protein